MWRPISSRFIEKSIKRAQSGFTLLELALYFGLLLILGGPLVTIVLVSSNSTAENDTINAVTERNRTAVMRVEKEVRRAIGSTVIVSDAGRTLTLTSPAGFDGSAIIPGKSWSFSLRPAAGEALNGKDDDGNGLVDEGDMVRRDVGSGVENTITSGIDLNASGFAPSGTGYTVTLASIGTNPKKVPFSVSKTITVYPRN